jgi:hypothetical protein
VIKLKRVRTGTLALGDLPEGRFRHLGHEEVKEFLDMSQTTEGDAGRVAAVRPRAASAAAGKAIGKPEGRAPGIRTSREMTQASKKAHKGKPDPRPWKIAEYRERTPARAGGLRPRRESGGRQDRGAGFDTRTDRPARAGFSRGSQAGGDRKPFGQRKSFSKTGFSSGPGTSSFTRAAGGRPDRGAGFEKRTPADRPARPAFTREAHAGSGRKPSGERKPFSKTGFNSRPPARRSAFGQRPGEGERRRSSGPRPAAPGPRRSAGPRTGAGRGRSKS